MKPTAKTIAKNLGISEAAVSMALNNKYGVSEKTRAKVFEEAIKLGMNVKSDVKTSVVDFIIYVKSGAVVADTPFFAELMQGIAARCKSYGARLNISYLYEGEKPTHSFNSLGVILLATEMDATAYKTIGKTELPTVFLDCSFDGLNVSSVVINNVEGAFMATSFLIKKYRCNPGYLHSSFDILNFDARSDGFYKAIRKNGLAPSASVVHRLSPSSDGAYADMNELLKHNETLAKCYFADNDLIAAGAIKAFSEHGYRIPDDIAVIGFDNMPICEYISPALSTVDVPKKFMGETAVDKLMAIKNGEKYVTKTEISTRLVLRSSTK